MRLRKKAKYSLDTVVVCCVDCGNEITRFHLPSECVADVHEQIDDDPSLRLCSDCEDKGRMLNALTEFDQLRHETELLSFDGERLTGDTYYWMKHYRDELHFLYNDIELNYIHPKDLAIAEAMVKKLRTVT